MAISEPTTVTTTLNYTSIPEGVTRPYFKLTSDPQTGTFERNYKEEPETVEIENLRGKEGSVSLDTTGFRYFKRASTLKPDDFADDTAIKERYYQESIELYKELTGATKVVIFDHTVRRHTPGADVGDAKKRQPAQAVHVDQSKRASIARVHRHLPAEEAEAYLKKRFQIINLWRPIKHAAYDHPLALCDYRSVDAAKDAIPITLVYPDFEGETMGIMHNLNHKWKYLRGMTPEEFVLIKCFDSKDDGNTAIFTPHTAFVDNTTPEGAPLRQSIELRALVFYD